MQSVAITDQIWPGCPLVSHF